MNHNFEKWIKNTYFDGQEPFGYTKYDMEKGWNACKQKTIDILSRYRQSLTEEDYKIVIGLLRDEL